MAVSRKLTVKDKRMLGLVLGLVFIVYALKRFYPAGFTQIANALNINEDTLYGTTDSLQQVGEGFVLFRVLGSVLTKGWVKTVAVWGSLVYALDGVAQLFNFDLASLFNRRNS